MYGVTKVFNENLGAYYHKKFGVDFRCLRYPGVVSSEKYAFNGTVSYATEIYFEALENGHYTHYLKPDTPAPLIYMDECLDATLQLIDAERSQLKRCVYNLAGLRMTPQLLQDEVEKLIPGTTFSVEVDPLRQSIAEGWPNSLDDSTNSEWGWKHDVSVADFAKKILVNIDEKTKSLRKLNI
uniref:NAD-dependent epimerase/dehydratase domain-containing protein n=1 Tax=Strombidium rassoulzadegani TaxID=1082188 RepID=A0A7S3CT54_9SPIT|mmetsp:Transcript_7891/g.13229  ORF Transcript_7891/g.13229 Transcript_7891/m.13229 type:complete len:182 (+) Transcript_7891:465-1010(+)